MNRTLKYTLLTLLWILVAVYVIWSAAAARRGRKARTVSRVEIEVVDSTSQGHLVSGAMVRRWIAASRLPIVGTAVDEVDLTAIERLIARNGFVDRAIAYIDYGAVLHIEISQRKPLLRLLTDGMNRYVTEEGYVFEAPRASSLYVPVVTGGYRPPFPADYSGEVRAHLDMRLAEIDRRIEELEHEKYPYYRREIENDRDLAAVRRMRIKRQWWRGESAEAFERRVEELRAEKTRLRRLYRYRSRVCRERIEQIGARQEAERAAQKKLEKSYEDFMKLLTFVKIVEEDDFWRSEVVQIAARTTPSGALEVELIPRSGRFTILFGRLDNVEAKFDKLLRFYRSGLSTIGWETYRTIDVRYRNQVVCKK